MPSTPKPTSCIPCAKRKVKCDRLEPCSHCKRRKDDICKYPLTKGHLESLRPGEDHRPYVDNSLNTSSRAFSAIVFEGTPTALQPVPVPASLPMPQGSKRTRDGTLKDSETCSRPQANLVELNKQTTYIEAPVWYSWSEARKPGNEMIDFQQETPHGRESQTDSHVGYHRTLLDSSSTASNIALYLRHPSAEGLQELWTAFLTNVHPVVKIFFDWDKEPIIHKAANDPASLTLGQQALCFSIYFITALSLSDTECKAMLNCGTKSSLLNDYQCLVEAALVEADYVSTSDLVVVQALVLYLLAMRNRAKPTTSFSLMGIIVRLSQRLGLHRDGEVLHLSPMRAEERRRIWWQMQHMEMMIAQLVGCVSLTLYAHWDTRLPANLDDDDITLDTQVLKPDRPGLTSMSHCLWRYQILVQERARRVANSDVGFSAPHNLSQAENDAVMERYRRPLAEQFLQYCELVNPLHVLIQIGIQNFLLALRRAILQPNIAGARTSEMSQSDRDNFLKVCIKCMDYYILGETTPSIAHFRWQNENYFQWTALVYILIEAYHRAATPEASTLWTLINKVCQLHPKLTTALGLPEVYAVARLITRAWQQRRTYLQEERKPFEKPWCVEELEKMLSIQSPVSNENGQSLLGGLDDLETFDFDLIDWSIWEKGEFV